jgi:membrane protein
MMDRLKRLAAEADAWLLRHRWTRVLRRAVLGFLQHEALQNAGSMAYFSILSVFQLLVLGVVVLSYFVGEGGARQFIIEQVRAGSPLDTSTIGSVIDAVVESRGGISLFGLIFLVWGALGVFSAVNQGVSRAFSAASPRPFWQDKLVGLLLMIVTGLLGVASMVIGIVTGIVQSAAAEVVAGVPGGYLALSAIGFALPLLLILAAFLVLYRVVPNRPVTLREVWPGAVAATLLWTVLRIGFTYYATQIANYDTAFGPISAAISLLVFLYFASVIVLLGAEIARANVLEDEAQEALAAQASWHGDVAETTAEASDGTTERSTRPAWALALGAAITGLAVRVLSRRRRGR